MNCSKSKVINRLALVLISIMVLELVLIGDQVQPVKAIKKKMLVKKLKKLLPLLALVKPKKKIILLPIPIPMLSKDHGGYPPAQHRPLGGFGGPPHLRPHHHHYQNTNGQVPPAANGGGQPMSFMMMAEPGVVPNTMSVNMIDVSPMASAGEPYGGGSFDNEPMMSMMMPPPVAPSGSSNSAPMIMPSMTMTIQSEPGGGSNIELSTNMAQPSTTASQPAQNQSGALVRPRTNYKWRPQHQQVQQHVNDQFQEEQYLNGGDQYYSSPWVSARPPPLASPAKLFRTHNHQSGGGRFPSLPPPPPRRPQSSQQWAPPSSTTPSPPPPSQAPRAQLELEEFVAAGPPQLMPVYQTANGQLHIAPPREQEDLGPPNDEVQTIGEHQATPRPVIQQQQQRPSAPIKGSGRLVSPAAKGKQQQQQLKGASGGY